MKGRQQQMAPQGDLAKGHDKNGEYTARSVAGCRSLMTEIKKFPILLEILVHFEAMRSVSVVDPEILVSHATH